MKARLLNIVYFTVILITGVIFNAYMLLAQEEQKTNEADLDPMRFYKAKYDATYKVPMDKVVDAVRGAIQELSCVIVQDVMKATDDGFSKAIIKSDYCVFAEGDSTFDKLKKFSVEMPFIRGGAWKNGRMQYKFIITEQSDETIYLLLQGNMSGYENFVTNKFHFWQSNGILEHDILENIEKRINQAPKN